MPPEKVRTCSKEGGLGRNLVAVVVFRVVLSVCDAVVQPFCGWNSCAFRECFCQAFFLFLAARRLRPSRKICPRGVHPAPSFSSSAVLFPSSAGGLSVFCFLCPCMRCLRRSGWSGGRHRCCTSFTTIVSLSSPSPFPGKRRTEIYIVN